jgi:hypothetical protein
MPSDCKARARPSARFRFGRLSVPSGHRARAARAGRALITKGIDPGFREIRDEIERPLKELLAQLGASPTAAEG